jgi:F-box/leucine-rich repeat protein 2/20
LRHLNVSDCEIMDDIGVLALLQSCTGLHSLELDNTSISDLVLIETAAMVRRRAPRTNLTGVFPCPPTIGLFLRAHDCPKVTWTGIRGILSHNAEVITTNETAQIMEPKKEPINSPETVTEVSSSQPASNAQLLLSDYATPGTHNLHEHTYPTQIIAIYMDFYAYQQILDEHTRRVLRVDLPAARRLELRSAELVVAHEEMAAGGGRRRLERRRAREAQRTWADEMGLSIGTGARTWKRLGVLNGSCTIM